MSAVDLMQWWVAPWGTDSDGPVYALRTIGRDGTAYTVGKYSVRKQAQYFADQYNGEHLRELIEAGGAALAATTPAELRQVPHANTSGYLAEWREVELGRDSAGGYVLVAGVWRALGEFPTIGDAEYELDLFRAALSGLNRKRDPRFIRTRWRALMDARYFA